MILIVHGIGCERTVQQRNLTDFTDNIKFLIRGGYLSCDYAFETAMIDWKTTVDNSDLRQRSQKCHISTQVGTSRELFNSTAPDIIQYLNKEYGSVIRQTIIKQMNEVYSAISQKHSKFKGKVSVIAHSLGTVITYDVLNF